MAHKIYTELQVFLGKEMREAARGRRGRKRRATQQKPDVFHAQIPAVELCQFLKIGNCELGFLLPVGEMRSCQLENDSFSVPIPVPISDNLLKAAEEPTTKCPSAQESRKKQHGKMNLDLEVYIYRLVQKKGTVLVSTSLAWPAAAGQKLSLKLAPFLLLNPV